MKKDKPENKSWLKVIIFFILGGFLVKLFACFSNLFNLCKKKKIVLDNVKDNFDDFVDKEGQEVEDLKAGKKSLKKYCQTSACIFKDYFIPNGGNDHKPKILRIKPLLIIVILSILLKAGVVGYTFFIYPNVAEMEQKITAEILVLTNQDRQDNNLPCLQINSALSSAAQAKADDMIANDYFSHYGLDGKKPWDWIDQEQYAYVYAGENLAMNFFSADSAQLALMQSQLHKKNILNDKYEDIGLAIASGVIDGKNTTVLVELFGGRKKTELATAVKVDDKIDITPAENVKTEVEVLASEGVKEEVKTDAVTEIEEKNIIAENEINETEDNQENIIAQIEPTGDLNQEISYVAQQKSKEFSTATALIIFSKYFYAIVLVAIIILLLINILVQIRIQHKTVIAQSLLMIVFLFGLLFIKFNVLESLAEKIVII